ncbi:porin [Rhodoferax sp.]|uniref:porin n=1 Tax=Rhodoferax sp. TaxID=50421 RepID=UPI00283D0467|nr:porin [Rhodoferax sp.]MDR3368274.1 porin [Rhodoferax sp.]
MKKSLIALAVLAASGAAMAQSSVTLYGILDGFLGSSTTENAVNKTAASVTQTVLNSGSVNGTRWGMKGTEDLGGGLSTIFDLQSGFGIDTGAAQQSGLLFGREAFVGLSGGFGTVVFGRVSLPFYDNEGMNDAMLNSSVSAQSNVMRTANNWGPNVFDKNALTGYALRGDNAVRYSTPNMSGFVGTFAYTLNEKTQSIAPQGNGNGGEIASASLVYAAGPVSGVLAYQKETPYQPAGVGAAGTAYAGTNASDRSYLRLSGQYDFGMIIAKAGYGRVDNVNFIQDAKTNEYQLGLDYKASAALVLSGGIASSKDDATATIGELKRTAFTLGGKYVMSKRTFLYGGYESGKQTLANSPDAKESILAFGMQHRF